MTSNESRKLQVCPSCDQPTARWSGQVEKTSEWFEGKIVPGRTYKLICEGCRHSWDVTTRLAQSLPLMRS